MNSTDANGLKNISLPQNNGKTDWGNILSPLDTPSPGSD